jgi:hypothetical protein
MSDPISDRRSEKRLLCSHLVELRWIGAGVERRVMGVLEEISGHGACVQCETSIPPGTAVRIGHGTGVLEAAARYSRERGGGYTVGMALRAAWSPDDFLPQHLFDPAELRVKRAE